MSQDKHHYSVPFHYIGQHVRVIYTRSIVRIFDKQGRLIAVHPRTLAKSGYTTKKEHLCSHHQYYKKRSPSYYMQRAYKHSEELYQYVQGTFKQDTYPEQLYRSCEGVLKLAKQTDKNQFIKACNIAIAHSNYSYGFLKRILENKMYTASEDETKENYKPLPEHNNIRGPQAYK